MEVALVIPTKSFLDDVKGQRRQIAAVLQIKKQLDDPPQMDSMKQLLIHAKVLTACVLLRNHNKLLRE